MAHNVRKVAIGSLVVLASVVGFGTAASADAGFGTDGTRVTSGDSWDW